MALVGLKVILNVCHINIFTMVI